MIYRFRELSPKDQMRLEVDFYGEPIPEVTEEMIENIISLTFDGLDTPCVSYAEARRLKNMSVKIAAKAIKKMYGF